MAWGGRDPNGFAVPARAGRLRIECAPASYVPGVLYQYRLDPSEEEWSDWTGNPFVEYTNLWEGHYTFRVRTKVRSDNPGPEAAIPFRVLPPWYRSFPAYLGYMALLILLMAGFSRLRHRALTLRTQELKARGDEQTETLAKTVDQLRLAKEEVDRKNRQLEGANAFLTSLSLRDSLTGIANRRALEETLDLEWRRALRSGQRLGFILMDLDFFKRLHDTRGHQVGDECLKAVAGFLQENLRRGSDFVGRYGGEEFALILPGTDLEGSVHLAESLRAGLEALAIPHPASPFRSVTGTFGAASILPSSMNLVEDLVQAADQALYVAKTQGRNRVNPEWPPPPPAKPARPLPRKSMWLREASLESYQFSVFSPQSERQDCKFR